MIKITPYQIDYFNLWNDFLAKAKNANFLFHRNFMEYHSDRFQDNSLLIFKNKKLIALLPANRSKNTVYSHQGLTYGGLILEKKIRSSEVFQIFKNLLVYFKQQGIKQLFYKQSPDYQSISSCQAIEIALFSIKASLQSCEICSVIELQKDFKILQKTRIKSTFDPNLIIKKEEDFYLFWELLNQHLTNKYKLSAVHSAKEIQNLAQKFKKNIELYTVWRGDKLLGGTVLFVNHYTGVVHMQYAANNTEGRKYGIHDLLFPFLIQKYQEGKTSFGQKFYYFSFGISDIRETKSINKGLVNWKEKFGARTFAHRSFKIEI